MKKSSLGCTYMQMFACYLCAPGVVAFLYMYVLIVARQEESLRGLRQFFSQMVEHFIVIVSPHHK